VTHETGVRFLSKYLPMSQVVHVVAVVIQVLQTEVSQTGHEVPLKYLPSGQVKQFVYKLPVQVLQFA
jgi:hypothetical protein